jgi:cell division protein FtsX
VSVRSDLELGIRLAVAGGRSTLTRLLLIASGISLGVGLLLSTLGVFPAENAVERRQLARELEVLDGPGPLPPDRYLAAPTSTTFGERAIAVTYLAPVGRPATAPWLPRILHAGEIVASPDLTGLLASPDGVLLRPRFPGPIVGTLDRRWLLHPGELVAYVGADRDDLGPDAEVVTGFGLDPVRHQTEGIAAYERPLFQVAFLVSVGLLIPILVFVVTGARLSASARESRLAAVRLVGGTPAQARMVAAGESLLAGLVGCAMGVAVFLLARPLLAHLAPPGDRWFPSDLAPSSAIVAAVIAAVLALSVGASLVSLRRVVVTPLGVVRGGEKRVRSWWRWAMLGTGLGGLWISMAAEDTVFGNNRLVVPFLVASYGLTALGAAAAAPVAGSAIARFLARAATGPGVTLGARRLAVDPRAAGRTVGGIVIVVIAGAITSLYAAVYTEAIGSAYFPSSLRATTVIVEPATPEPFDTERLRGVDGVVDVAPAWLGYTRHGYTVLVADCEAVDAAVVEDLPRCELGDALVNERLYDGGDSFRPVMRIQLDLAPKLHVEIRATNLERADVELGEFHQLLVPPSATGIDLAAEVAPSVVYVTTDGDPATLELIRNAVHGPDAPVVRPRGELGDYADEVSGLVNAGVTFGIAITFAIAAATMLVTAVDAVGERRRSLATLAAVGASRSVLRRALAIETTLPMLSGVVLGLAAAILGTWMVFKGVTAYEGIDEMPTIQWRSLGYVVVFAIVATIVATIATFPSLGRAIRPDSLRME